MAQKPQWMVAQDTFSTDLESGAVVSVTRGETYPAGHEVVLKDGGRGVLFKPLEAGEPDEEPSAVPKTRIGRGAPVKGA